jgi:hypothetical protein
MRKESKVYLRLSASVLQRAIDDLYYDPSETAEGLTEPQDTHVARELHWKRQAQAWFKNNSKAFSSFEGICLILGLEPSLIRKRLHERGLL